MIEIILLIISAIIGVVLVSIPKINPTPTPTPTIKPKKRVRFKEPIMSYSQTNHVTSELMRQKAELSRNNSPGNELLHVNKFNWAPSVNY
jgi:hypothetical protein|tara:strand:- start:670 stop:939 length:270 start_codon:yes stop_codon:yes gene_type:complete